MATQGLSIMSTSHELYWRTWVGLTWLSCSGSSQEGWIPTFLFLFPNFASFEIQLQLQLTQLPKCRTNSEWENFGFFRSCKTEMKNLLFAEGHTDLSKPFGKPHINTLQNIHHSGENKQNNVRATPSHLPQRKAVAVNCRIKKVSEVKHYTQKHWSLVQTRKLKKGIFNDNKIGGKECVKEQLNKGIKPDKNTSRQTRNKKYARQSTEPVDDQEIQKKIKAVH